MIFVNHSQYMNNKKNGKVRRPPVSAITAYRTQRKVSRALLPRFRYWQV